MNGTTISPSEVKLCEHGHIPVLEECIECEHAHMEACLIKLGCQKGRDGRWARPSMTVACIGCGLSFGTCSAFRGENVPRSVRCCPACNHLGLAPVID